MTQEGWTAQAFDAWLPWDTNPLYALLHEAIYCQGAASGWAAQRVRDAHFTAEFDAVLAVANGANVMFTGWCTLSEECKGTFARLCHTVSPQLDKTGLGAGYKGKGPTTPVRTR